MGTRGFITFVAGGAEKTAYNHCDSYPDGLGLTVLEWLRGAVADEPALREKVAALRVVDSESAPAAEDVERLRPWTNLGVGNQSTADWYCLLRETQGKPGEMLAAGVVEDAKDFPRDSLYAEYGYVVDADTQTFEAYEGFQRSPHKFGRFAGREPVKHSVGDYYPVALVASWSFDSLPDDDAFAAAFGTDEDEDES